jgi:ornithine cyclodeaminase/alanine dehydrogenase-like protein (mu-crystallin family)
MLPAMIRSLSEDDVRRLTFPDVIKAIDAAFRHRYPHCVIPARVHIPTVDGVFLMMSCYDPAQNTLGMKLVTVRDNPQCPEDRVEATYLLLDPVTARPRTTIQARYLTDLRTSATSAVATHYLAREDAKTLGIFGTGREADAHIRAMCSVREFERVFVCGRDPSRTEAFAQKMRAELNLPVEAADSAKCAAESDVLCTCTNSSEPVFDGTYLKHGAHLNVIGAFQPHTREVDTATIQRSRIVVETYDGVLAEAGDLLIPIKEGAIARDHILSDLHEVVSGKKTVRSSPEENTLFKSVGCALEDLVTAELAEKLANA